MKNFIWGTIKAIAFTALGTVAILVCLALLVMSMQALGIESAHNRESIKRATANCEQRGGQWITNPNSYIPSKAFGEGCSIDYNARKYGHE